VSDQHVCNTELLDGKCVINSITLNETHRRKLYPTR